MNTQKIYTPLSHKEASQLLDLYMIGSPYKTILLPQITAIDTIPEEYESVFFVKYADRVMKAHRGYEYNIENITKEIEEIRKEGDDFSKEDEDEYRKDMEILYYQFLQNHLKIAETYNNDLYNYIYSLICEWNKLLLWRFKFNLNQFFYNKKVKILNKNLEF